MILRALLVWLLIGVAEVLHGIVRVRRAAGRAGPGGSALFFLYPRAAEAPTDSGRAPQTS